MLYSLTVHPYTLTCGHMMLRYRMNCAMIRICMLVQVDCVFCWCMHTCTVHSYVMNVRMYVQYVHTYVCTVKPVYNDHSRDQVIVVSVDRWSLYGGVVVLLKWTMSQPTVVSIDRWSFHASGL